MSAITRAQRVALKSVFDRNPLIMTDEGPKGYIIDREAPLISYRDFRKTASRSGDNVAVKWCGSDLIIEPNGHTHT